MKKSQVSMKQNDPSILVSSLIHFENLAAFFFSTLLKLEIFLEASEGFGLDIL